MKVTSVDHGKTSHAERQGTGKRASWGDCGLARPSTQAYEDGMDRIFGKKSVEDEPKVRTPEEQAKLERNARIRMAYPY